MLAPCEVVRSGLDGARRACRRARTRPDPLRGDRREVGQHLLVRGDPPLQEATAEEEPQLLPGRVVLAWCAARSARVASNEAVVRAMKSAMKALVDMVRSLV